VLGESSPRLLGVLVDCADRGDSGFVLCGVWSTHCSGVVSVLARSAVAGTTWTIR